ncbi:MAG: MaoC family dehydratase [Hyphomicrobiales bacterium]|nr:MaoC family dehydratase [Hyphomicrobiales bacterium]
MSTHRHFEDFVLGETIDLGAYPVTKEEIIAFASEFDPQPFHVNEAAAKAGFFGGLVASGWHTVSMFMRMYYDQLVSKVASEGAPGVDDLKWLRPVRPGDVLGGSATVTGLRASRSRPEIGFVSFDFVVTNQDDEAVMTLKSTGMLRRREASS